ncbi:bifunctional phosphopantothenoylcysteine decarboxylase/phosphopantothenate--cysteine ligase CoaBC, partial [Candidatus Saccharibacteria bacterium]|nr:bifunctional phosphopantothenoylcysteine decarboxylase/phosphopantothenate--cysteine ligase CoaBC [Candidatus Saccharibacteria bacterium]
MTNYLKDQKILIGITGGIAAYKILELIRRLREQGALVKTILTNSSKQFITPLSVHALSGEPACDDAMQHIELARWADIFLIAPATANFIAKAAHGLADDLLSSTYLATSAKVLLAPAMNQQMWQHPGTQENLHLLKTKHNITIVGPAVGSQACGEYGPGRMVEPEELLSAINTNLMPKILSGKNIIITAGPTREALDPVRYLSNHSSGKMGYALARAAQQLGAKVTLISGPTNLTPAPGIQLLACITAADMYNYVMQELDKNATDIFIGCAAVADYRPVITATQKLKKSRENFTLEFEPTADILAAVAKSPSRPLTIGFAAETEDLLGNAQQKLQYKNLDLIIANSVTAGSTFGEDFNEV